MFELEVNAEFCAAHAIVIYGEREAIHGHNWQVTLTIAGPNLNQDGLLCDFHEVQSVLNLSIDGFQNTNLNSVPPFDQLNPTTEHVAKYIAKDCQKLLRKMLPRGAHVSACRVTEAAGCAATYRPRSPGSTQANPHP